MRRVKVSIRADLWDQWCRDEHTERERDAAQECMYDAIRLHAEEHEAPPPINFDADAFYDAAAAVTPSPEPNPGCPACRELKQRETVLEWMVRVMGHMLKGHAPR